MAEVDAGRNARVEETTVLESFRSFLTRARELAPTVPGSTNQSAELGIERPSVKSAGAIDVDSFRRFVLRASPLATARARAWLSLFAPFAAALEPWLLSVDLLSVAGCSMEEDRYTALLAWALSPRAGLASPALASQNALLREAGVSVCLQEPMVVRPWLPTDDGIYPDLVLHNESLLVVVEAKTRSAEHEAGRTGRMQTEAYLEAARASLRMSSSTVGHTVFLTVNGSVAANPAARSVTYSRLALAFAKALSPLELPADVRFAYATIITHWIEQTSAPGKELCSSCKKAASWLNASDEELLRDLDTIIGLENAWPLRRIDHDNV